MCSSLLKDVSLFRIDLVFYDNNDTMIQWLSGAPLYTLVITCNITFVTVMFECRMDDNFICKSS